MTVPGVPAWHPDPTGRHELRWWDGAAFTDQVADGGTTSTDPGPGATSGPRPPTGALPADVTGRRASKLPVVLAAAGAFVVVLALLFLLRDEGGGSGTGAFSGTVEGNEDGRHEASIAGGTVLVVELDPDSDFDAVVGFELDDEDADRVEELYEGTAFEGAAEENDGLVFRRDVGFDGGEEVTFLAVPFGVDATVVVTGFDGAEGDYDITIDAFDLELDDDDPDGDDVLDAVVEADGVPRAVSEAIEAAVGD